MKKVEKIARISLLKKIQGSDIMTDKQRYQAERWKILIEDETKNEMKLKDWLKLRGITKDAYYYWLHKFQRENIDTALQDLPAQIQQTPSFVEISKPEAVPLPEPVITEPETQAAAVIRTSQMQIELFPNASADMIREIMRAASNV